ncbi:hypothetical protein FA95DRAFT_1457961, partial [Auriscalpium vulgare]
PVQSTNYPHHDDAQTARICARFISHLFACQDHPPLPSLEHFIARALHRAHRLPTCVAFAALYLLLRLKIRFPGATGSSGQRLFITSFMIASKVLCDWTYSNQNWCRIARGAYVVRDINRMEREMCDYLEWRLNIDGAALQDFEERVR